MERKIKTIATLSTANGSSVIALAEDGTLWRGRWIKEEPDVTNSTKQDPPVWAKSSAKPTWKWIWDMIPNLPVDSKNLTRVR